MLLSVIKKSKLLFVTTPDIGGFFLLLHINVDVNINLGITLTLSVLWPLFIVILFIVRLLIQAIVIKWGLFLLMLLLLPPHGLEVILN